VSPATLGLTLANITSVPQEFAMNIIGTVQHLSLEIMAMMKMTASTRAKVVDRSMKISKARKQHSTVVMIEVFSKIILSRSRSFDLFFAQNQMEDNMTIALSAFFPF
jgi:hypothetical protein